MGAEAVKAQPDSDNTTKERILLAAEHEFADKGLTGARTREIAARADVNVAQLHYHFGSKRDLYGAVLRNAAQRLQRTIGRAFDEAVDPVERLGNAVRAHFDALAARPHLPRLLLDAALRQDPFAREIAHEGIRPVLDRVLPALAEGIASGALRPVDFFQTVISAFGMNAIYFVARQIVEEVLGTEAYGEPALVARREAVTDLLLHGLLPRPAPAAPEAPEAQEGRP